MKHYTLEILEEGTGLPQASAQFTVPNMKTLYLRNPRRRDRVASSFCSVYSPKHENIIPS